MTTNPFSGLSLIVHLLVIALSSVFSLFVWKKEKTEENPRLFIQDSFWFRAFKYVVSFLVIISVSAIMLTSFVIALNTGIREGSREPHIQYIRNEYARMREARIDPSIASITQWIQGILPDGQVNAASSPEEENLDEPVAFRPQGNWMR